MEFVDDNKYMFKKGYKMSEEHKRKIAEGRMGDKNWSKRPEVRKKIGIASLGRRHTEKTKDKIRENSIKLGLIPPKFSELSKEKQEVLRIKRSGWKGGKTTILGLEKIAGRKKPEQCEICGAFSLGTKGRGICFDHDHKTGKFRGWLCHRCNTVLGFVRDDSELLINLSEYLKKSKEGACH